MRCHAAAAADAAAISPPWRHMRYAAAAYKICRAFMMMLMLRERRRYAQSYARFSFSRLFSADDYARYVDIRLSTLPPQLPR